MTRLHPLVRPSSPGWVGLARFLAAPAAPRATALPAVPTMYRSECFAEDLLDLPPPPTTARRPPPSI